MRTTFQIVDRDQGNTSLASDWAGICDIDVLASTGIDYVALFVDQSGSMSLDTVLASYNKFVEDLATAGLTFQEVLTTQEDWITPFIVILN